MLRVIESDSDLLCRWQSEADEEAFATLVDRYGGLVSGVCRRHSRSRQDAEDAFQAVFFLLARDADSIRDPARLPGWLLTVAMRIAVKIRRESHVNAMEPDSLASLALSPLERLSERHQLCALDEELAELPDRFRQPLVLHFLEGLSYQETAARLRTTVGSVRNRLRTGTRRLRRRLVQRGVSVAGVVVLTAAARRAEAAFAFDCAPLQQHLLAGPLPRGIDPDTTFTSLLSPSSFFGVTTMKVTIGLTIAGMLVAGATLIPVAGQGGGDKALLPLGPSPDQPTTLIAGPAPALGDETSYGFLTRTARKPSEWIGGSGAVYERFDAALQDQGTYEFLDEALESVAQLLSEQHQIPIVIDERALDDLGLTRDTPVTISVPNISLQSALNLILTPKDLTYSVENEVLMITSLDAAKDNLLARTYWIEDATALSSLIEAIENSIAPQGWEAVGGSGTITPITLADGKQNALVVLTEYTTHRKIEALLQSIFPDRERTTQSAGTRARADKNAPANSSAGGTPPGLIPSQTPQPRSNRRPPRSSPDPFGARNSAENDPFGRGQPAAEDPFRPQRPAASNDPFAES